MGQTDKCANSDGCGNSDNSANSPKCAISHMWTNFLGVLICEICAKKASKIEVENLLKSGDFGAK